MSLPFLIDLASNEMRLGQRSTGLCGHQGRRLDSGYEKTKRRIPALYLLTQRGATGQQHLKLQPDQAHLLAAIAAAYDGVPTAGMVQK